MNTSNQITVKGDASLTVEGNYTYTPDDSSGDPATDSSPLVPIEVDTGNVTIEGDLNVTGDRGIFVSGGNSSVEVDGSLVVTADKANATGIEIRRDYVEPSPGSVDIKIEGDLSVTGTNPIGVYSYSSFSPISIEITGDVIVDNTIFTQNADNPLFGQATGLNLQAAFGDIAASVGDVTVTGSNANVTGIEYFAQAGHQLIIDTGNIVAEGYMAINGDTWGDTRVDSSTQTKTIINADGDVLGGAQISVHQGGQTELNISGNADYLNLFAMGEGSHMTINVGKDASILIGGGPNINSSLGPTLELHIEGSAVTNDDHDGLALSAGVDGESDLQISVDNNIEGTLLLSGSNYDSGTALTSVNVGGDVTGGIVDIYSTDKPADKDVYIENTLSSSGDLITIDGRKDVDSKLQLTVWKIELDGRDSIVAAGENSVVSQEKLDTVEKNILYIIRLEQPKEGGEVGLSSVSQSHDKDVAKEGDTVTVTPLLQSGYRIAAVYNNGTALTLQDSEGNYYLIVPKGGGVSLTVKTEEFVDVEPTEETDETVTVPTETNTDNSDDSEPTPSSKDSGNKHVNLKDVKDTKDTSALKDQINQAKQAGDPFRFLPQAIKITLPAGITKVTDMGTVSLDKYKKDMGYIVFNLKSTRRFKAGEKALVMIALPDKNGNYTYLVLEGTGMTNNKLEIPVTTNIAKMLAGNTCIAEIYLHPKWQFSRKLNDSGQSERTLLLFERLSP